MKESVSCCMVLVDKEKNSNNFAKIQLVNRYSHIIEVVLNGFIEKKSSIIKVLTIIATEVII